MQKESEAGSDPLLPDEELTSQSPPDQVFVVFHVLAMPFDGSAAEFVLGDGDEQRALAAGPGHRVGLAPQLSCAFRPLGGVSAAAHDDAPTAPGGRVELVYLEDGRFTALQARERSVRVGAEDDLVVVDEVGHRKDLRTFGAAPADTANGCTPQPLATCGCRQHMEAVVEIAHALPFMGVLVPREATSRRRRRLFAQCQAGPGRAGPGRHNDGRFRSCQGRVTVVAGHSVRLRGRG